MTDILIKHIFFNTLNIGSMLQPVWNLQELYQDLENSFAQLLKLHVKFLMALVSTLDRAG